MLLLERPFVLFLLSYIIGLICSLAWFSFGESWTIFGDAVHYVSVYNGQLAPAPWGFRIMTPFFAQLLPWDIYTNFGIISINSMALTTGVLALYGKKIGLQVNGILLLIFFLVISYPFAYYSSAIVRADAPMLLILAIIFYLSKYKVSPIILLILITFGTFFHEMILIAIPALCLDKIFSGSLTGGSKYQFSDLFILSFGSLVIMIIVRSFFMNVLPTADEFLPNISILEYTGGVIKHALRIYAAYGPALLFCIFFIALNRLSSIIYPFAGLMSITILATLFATDTLRVMSILFLPILLYASQYLMHMKKNHYEVPIFLALIQALYSLTVFGHLRSFEASSVLNIVAAVISVVSLILCVIINKNTH
jgi:hypothetical protein